MSQVCIIIPTFNNEGTILQVISDVQRQGMPVMVVNDGSTDKTAELLQRVEGIHSVSYDKNRGKGYALRQGFAKALELGYTHVITMDADGQHYAADIPAFLEEHAAFPDALIVGSRNLTSDNIPAGNTFANKFSNFWFRLQTFCNLPDTQTGFRLYPLKPYRRLWWLTDKYEAELELLVSAAWRGVELRPIAIQVYYPPQGERVTHFRPFMDFARISVLNTVLCFLAVVYGYPRMLMSKLLK